MPRLHRWLVLIGLFMMASPFLLTLVSRGSLRSNRTWAASLELRVDSLIAVGKGGTSPDSAVITMELASAERGLQSARYHLTRAERRLETLWRWTGQGPLLLAIGSILIFLGYRVFRFEQFGD
jgi:hypothetical protein